jgi:hypothetical protein
MIRTLKKRDFKEKEIDTTKEAERINKQTMIRIQNYSNEMLANYQIWKTENKVPGIKY